jgi:hypothetical protein
MPIAFFPCSLEAAAKTGRTTIQLVIKLEAPEQDFDVAYIALEKQKTRTKHKPLGMGAVIWSALAAAIAGIGVVKLLKVGQTIGRKIVRPNGGTQGF